MGGVGLSTFHDLVRDKRNEARNRKKRKLKVGKRGREKRKEDREGVEGAQQREMREVVVESIALVEFSDNGEKLSFFFFFFSLAALRLSMRLSWGRDMDFAVDLF